MALVAELAIPDPPLVVPAIEPVDPVVPVVPLVVPDVVPAVDPVEPYPDDAVLPVDPVSMRAFVRMYPPLGPFSRQPVTVTSFCEDDDVDVRP